MKNKDELSKYKEQKDSVITSIQGKYVTFSGGQTKNGIIKRSI